MAGRSWEDRCCEQAGEDPFGRDDGFGSQRLKGDLAVTQQSQDTLVLGLCGIGVQALMQSVVDRGQGQEEVKEGGADAEGAPGNRPKLGTN
ncbi:MAG: hypothetical protein KJ072_06455 [Verrucomicrobia bacterium]|nr:hypothetical protein [Verrucomicrobiota bacterium]